MADFNILFTWNLISRDYRFIFRTGCSSFIKLFFVFYEQFSTVWVASLKSRFDSLKNVIKLTGNVIWMIWISHPWLNERISNELYVQFFERIFKRKCLNYMQLLAVWSVQWTELDAARRKCQTWTIHSENVKPGRFSPKIP